MLIFTTQIIAKKEIRSKIWIRKIEKKVKDLTPSSDDGRQKAVEHHDRNIGA